MSARPWMKWYPGDWRADPLLRSCDPLSRYVWMEMIGLMHEAEPYGHLVLAGRAMDYLTLSRVIGMDQGDVKGAVKELESRGVFDRTNDGVIVSRRMVRDETKRKTLQKNGAKGGNPKLLNQELSDGLDNQGRNQGVKAQNPDARVSVSNDTGVPPPDLKKQVFDLGLSLVMQSGKTEGEARKMVGLWRKGKSDAEVLAGFLDCQAQAISDPLPWLQARFKGARYVSASGYEYRGNDEAVMREAEKRADWNTYYSAKRAVESRAA